MHNECPHGGDINNECEDCDYAGDYKFDPKTSECIRRDEV